VGKKHVTWFLVLILMIGALAFLYGRADSQLTPSPASQPNQSSNSQSSTTETKTYQNIPAKELNNWLNAGKDILLIDVREPSEFKDGYIKGAINIPLGQFENRLQEIPKEKDVVVYCRSGRRSAEASQILVKNGYRKVFNLEGGIMNWPFEVIKQQVSSGTTTAA